MIFLASNGHASCKKPRAQRGGKRRNSHRFGLVIKANVIDNKELKFVDRAATAETVTNPIANDTESKKTKTKV
uniref:Uncharacterized protein n=1 Tax=Manihot esculenta TaxID=3983 RepID=A0A2C9V101_MANES